MLPGLSAPPAQNELSRVDRWLWPAVLAFVVAISVLSYVLLHRAGNTHATIVFLALFYILALPLFALYWRTRNDSTQPDLLSRKWSATAIILFGVLAGSIGKTADHAALITDESSYLFQARIFAAGKLKAAPLPGASANPKAAPTAISFAQTIQNDKGWFSKYPPGWPSILAIGYLLHCPWLINPLFGVVQLLLIFCLARSWGATTQNLAVLMAATSAYFLVESVGAMSHAAESTVTLFAILTLFRGTRERRLRWIAVCFFLVACATEIRPYTGAVVGLVCTISVIVEFRHNRKLLSGALAILCGSAVLAIASFMLTNRLYTGDPLLSPYALFEGTRKIREITFNPRIITYNILNTWRWSVADTIRVSFPFGFLFAAYALWKEKQHRAQLVYLALLFPLLVLAYFLQIEGSSSFDGERYYFEGFGAFTIVVARGFLLLTANWKVPRARVITALLAMLAVQLAMVIDAIPDVESRAAVYHESYRLAQAAPRPPLIFFGGASERFAFASTHENWNAPDWRSAPVVYLNDPGPSGRDEYACLVGRTAYRVVDYEPSGRFLVSNSTVVCPSKSPSH
ncbi:MAG: glycosyltransferase family 39 protein [Acidobacteriaceae bacterium]|nr:glycosyltransferase family 39 protein [Acidobacteriaceae bacterium]